MMIVFAFPVYAFNFANFLRFDRIQNEFASPYKSEALNPKQERLAIAFISDVNLYPAPISPATSFAQDAQAKPLVNSIVLYDQSQVLLQEAIREIIQLAGTEGLDLVIFGGSQVCSNDHYELFQDIITDLNKFSIPYYSMVGTNELNGSKKLCDLIKNRYYLLKTKTTSIIVLDNVTEAVVPEFLPEEATEQYIWLKRTLDELEQGVDDVYIFSYKPLDFRTKALINKYPALKLKLVAHSSLYEFSAYPADVNDGFVAKTQILSNASISAYPLSYSIIVRDSNGELKIRNKEIALEGIRKLAKQKWN